LEDKKRVEKRHYQRFKLDVEIKVNSRTAGRLTGHSIEISEYGMSAILVIEVPVGEVIQLEFKLPTGTAKALAFVRNRTAFRYGFEFVRPNPAQELIKSACAVLTRSEAVDS
jgi:hypothetical protein